MTDTDTIEQIERAHHHGTPDPSSTYDGAMTAADIDARYKASFPHGEDRLTIQAYQEDHRRAHVRHIGGHGRTVTPRRAATAVILTPVETDHGLVITCQGPCGEEKSFKKFPTPSGGRPGREAVCRSCRDAALAERKTKAAGR